MEAGPGVPALLGADGGDEHAVFLCERLGQHQHEPDTRRVVVGRVRAGHAVHVRDDDHPDRPGRPPDGVQRTTSAGQREALGLDGVAELPKPVADNGGRLALVFLPAGRCPRDAILPAHSFALTPLIAVAVADPMRATTMAESMTPRSSRRIRRHGSGISRWYRRHR